MNKGMALIEFLIGFLILTMLVACFLKASLFEEENVRIQKAKQEFSNTHQEIIEEDIFIEDDVSTEEYASEEGEEEIFEETLDETVEAIEETNIPEKKVPKSEDHIPQFIEILD